MDARCRATSSTPSRTPSAPRAFGHGNPIINRAWTMGYFDVQVNGYAGVDFNGDALTLEDLERACERLRHDDVEGILATFITAPIEVMCARLSRLAALREASGLVASVVAGVHLEGPFLRETPGFI